ncbi:WG repeat-containing protein [Thermoclostridium stercorarium]|uniref:WG repeat-containing protein n=1 Tax=Thermoclostridium stercorarium TaxID=1510 RepID=UPI0006CF93EE|nr:WG repeat-containing protein [Thermoclostridium stercorarium]
MSAKQENGAYLWGYVDNKGNFVIGPKYAYASEWNGNYGIVSKPEDPLSYFVINREEEHVAKNNDYYRGFLWIWGTHTIFCRQPVMLQGQLAQPA